MKKLRVGVVGLGVRGRTVFKLACDGFDFVEPAAACDIKEANWYEKQWQFQDAFCNIFPNTTFYTDYEKMLDEANLDVIIVETGADIHADFCVKALKKNVNVLTDIPVVASLDDADRLWKAAQESKAIISVGSNPNYQKFVVMLNDFYKKGLLGKPYCMEAEYIHWWLIGSEEEIHLNENGDWRRLLCPIRYCTHSLGPLLTILEEELRYVSCFGSGQHAEPDTYEVGNTQDDMTCAQFQTESGVVVRVMKAGNRCRSECGHHNYRVHGTEGYMERIDRFNKYAIRYNSMKELDTGLKEVSGEFTPPAYANDEKVKATGHDGLDFAMLDNFFKCLEEGKAAISLKEGLLMTLPGIYAEESSKRRGEVLTMYYPWNKEWTTEIK